MTVRGVIYARVSTTGQEESGSSLDTQLALCRRYAVENTLPVAPSDELLETHSGGELWERPKLSYVRDLMRQRAITDVVCYSVDRLSRSQIHLGLLLSEADHAGVTFHFVTEPLEKTAVGVFLQSARAFAAELEREKIRERSMRGKHARLMSGKLGNAGPDLYGYRRDSERGVREVCEDEAAIVREIFQAIAIEGVSTNEVVRRLNDRNVPPPGTGKFAYRDAARRRWWGTGQVNRILHNPAYRGDSIALRWAADHHKAGRPDYRPEEEWLRLPDGLTPAIITDAVWEAVQVRLATNRGEKARNENRPVLLRGHVTCAVCGRRMSPERDRHGQMVWRCGSRMTPAGACGASVTPNTLLEPDVWQRIVNALTDPRLIAPATQRVRRPVVRDTRRRDGLVRDVARLEARQKRLLEKFGASDDPAFPWEIVEEQVSTLQKERARLLTEIAALDTVRTPPAPPVLSLPEWVRVAARNLDALDFDGRRMVVEALAVRVTATGRTWSVEDGFGLL